MRKCVDMLWTYLKKIKRVDSICVEGLEGDQRNSLSTWEYRFN